MPDICVVIVNYASAALAIEAVESVRRADPADSGVEIHLVDNASPGADRAVLRDAASMRGWGAQVHLHFEDINHGFGEGNNVVLRALAARRAPPDKVFLLNPDAQIESDALVRLATFMDDHPHVGVAGCRILSPNGAPATAAFRFPSIAAEFAEAICFGPVSRILSGWSVPMPPDLPEGPVDWVSGAAMMARLAALESVDFFDPGFFLYYEEVDLMRRLRDAGWSVWHMPSAVARHAEGGATGVRSGDAERRRRPAYWYRSWAHYRRKTHGLLPGFGFAAARMVGAALNELLARLRGARPAAPLHFYADFLRHGVGGLFERNARCDQ